MSMLSRGMHSSKGKWIPGMKPNNYSVSQHYCDVCNRGFANSSSLQKHLASELHFKRRAENDGRDLRKNNDLFDETTFPRATYRENRMRNNSTIVRIGKNGQQTVQCPTCFSKVDKLLMGKHLISHFHCQKVSKKDRQTNPERSLILEHIQQIASQSPFQCGPCKYYFTQREQLLQHFELHHMKLETKLWSKRNILNRWSCSSCPEILANDEIEMLSHLTSSGHCKMEAAISKSIPIILRKVSLRSCLFCAKSFVLNRELASHIHKMHHSHRDIVPDIMSNAPVDMELSPAIKAEKARELETLYGVTDVKGDSNVSNPMEKAILLVCSICSKGFDRISSLNRHKAHAHRTESNIYSCIMCSYTTKVSSYLKRHFKQHNKNRKKLFQCEICSSAFFEIYALENHRKVHFKKTVPCKYPGCQFLGRNQSEVDTHNLRHRKEKQFTCDQCNYSSKTKFSLTRHIRLNHNNDVKKEYSCKLCSYSTRLYNCLKRHEFQHNDDKPFHCPHCTFSSKTLDNLRIHVVRRTVHSGRFLYNCSTCQPVSLEKCCFATNSFSDFKYHVTESHSDGLLVKSDAELLVIAGIKKTEPEIVKTTDQEIHSSVLESKSIYEGSQQVDNETTDLSAQKDLALKSGDIDPERFIADSHVDEKYCSDVNKLDEFSSKNSSVDDMFIDVLYGNLLIVSDEELQFANVKDDI